MCEDNGPDGVETPPTAEELNAAKPVHHYTMCPARVGGICTCSAVEDNLERDWVVMHGDVACPIPLGEVCDDPIHGGTVAAHLAIDLALTGNAYYDGEGKRVPPEDVTGIAVDGSVVATAHQDREGNTVVEAFNRQRKLVEGHVKECAKQQWRDLNCTCPPRQTVENLTAELGNGVPPTPQHVQADLILALDELLSASQHLPWCEIGPDDTNCLCLIGMVRAVMPMCTHVETQVGSRKWRCIRHAHPSDPDNHVHWVVP
jgi:hypothetical protein